MATLLSLVIPIAMLMMFQRPATANTVHVFDMTKHLNYHDNTKYRDCNELRKAGFTKEGEYTLWHNGSTPFKVRCKHMPGYSVAVMQRRVNPSLNFEASWQFYENGFTDSYGNYWMGLEHIFQLTGTGNYRLIVHLVDFLGDYRNITYQSFRLNSKADRYRLLLGRPISGNVVDDLSSLNNMQFGTIDYPDYYKCATKQRAGWWYNYHQQCALALLNGKYYPNGPYHPPSGTYDGIYWKDWRGFDYSLKTVEMDLLQV